MKLTRIMAAAALAAGLGIGSIATANAAVTATINIVNNNASTTMFHAKNPPSNQSDSFIGVTGWTVAPPDSILAGASDASAKITLAANQQVMFHFGSPNSSIPFVNECAFTLTANSSGTAFLSPSAAKTGPGTACSIVLVTGHPYNVQATVSGF